MRWFHELTRPCPHGGARAKHQGRRLTRLFMHRAARHLALVFALPLAVSCASDSSNASGSGPPDVVVRPHAAHGAKAPTLPPPPQTPGRQLGHVAPAPDRLSVRMPVIDPFVEVEGASAVDYFADVARALPRWAAFEDLASAAVCGSSYGPVEAKAYVSPDLTQGVGAVQLSESEADLRGRGVPMACLAGSAPTGDAIMRVDDRPAQPCAMKYYFDSRQDGVRVRHFVLVAGTSAGMCQLLFDHHAYFNPQLFDVA